MGGFSEAIVVFPKNTVWREQSRCRAFLFFSCWRSPFASCGHRISRMDAGRSSTPGSMSNVPVACTRPFLLGRELHGVFYLWCDVATALVSTEASPEHGEAIRSR